MAPIVASLNSVQQGSRVLQNDGGLQSAITVARKRKSVNGSHINPHCAQPIVRTHPDTRRKAFALRCFTLHWARRCSFHSAFLDTSVCSPARCATPQPIPCDP